MAEVEIKFEIPEAARERVVAAVRAGNSRSRSQRAIYVDTPSTQLSAAGFVLRLRREDDRWIQTVKAPGPSALERLEHEADCGSAGDEVPALDLSRHDGTDVGQALRAALDWQGGGAPGELAPRFEVAVERLIREVRHGHSTIELALDIGRVQAQDRQAPIRELELELKDGDVADLVSLAREWRRTHGLTLSVISKAHKGSRLAENRSWGEATTARPPAQVRGARAGAVAQAVLQACADQILANASEIAAGSEEPDHVHQLRIGIRRLRTALRELPLAAAAAEPALGEAMVHAFRALGEHRDRQHVVQALAPQVEAAGGGRLDLGDSGAQAPSPSEVVRDPAFQDALLQLVALAHDIDPAAGRRGRKQVAPTLERLLRKVLRDGRRFTELPPERQHGVRKRLKRLRYLSEFAAPQYRRAAVKRFIDELKPVQEALGHYNDGMVAAQVYRDAAARDPRAAFGAGWLTAQAPWQERDCAKALRRLRKAQPFWR